MRAALACVGFCLISSGIYILNDLVDKDADREHPIKRHRPLAAKRFPLGAAWALSSTLAGSGIIVMVLLGSAVATNGIAYLATMILYCFWLKRVMILDCVAIAAGFVLRVVAGAAAVHVPATHWLIACTFVLTLYLAFAKRRQELLVLSKMATAHRRVLGDYTGTYLDQVNNILLGIVIVCYALYAVAPETVQRFGTDGLIYGTVFVLYGMLRYMSLIQTRMEADPSNVVIQDKPLWISIVCWVLFNCLIIYQRELIDAGKHLLPQ